jgi:NAD(P)-dependent dehydrogenase (short-subunit alcohol dehydrogenase family)
MVQAFVPILKHQLLEKEYYGTTRIVNVVSMAALTTGGPGVSGYHASKHAAQAYTDGLRLELQPFHIAVTAINPGHHTTSLNESFDSMTGEKLMETISDETIKLHYGKRKNCISSPSWC